MSLRLSLGEALEILQLQTPFTLIELKSAYRQAVKRAHPDMGGSSEEFIKVDTAYDFLQHRATNDKTELGSSRWKTYYESQLPRWEKAFQTAWREAFKESFGLAYSTCIERFARGYIRPKDAWFRGVLFPNATEKQKEEYRAHLLAIAPNRTMAEVWARKYYRLEFGDETPWVFYLPGAVGLEGTEPTVSSRSKKSNKKKQKLLSE